MTAIANAYNTLNNALSEATSSILGTIYSITSATFFNGVAYTIIGVIICIWLLQRLKSGLGDKEQWFKAGTWLIAVAFVFASLSSKPAFDEFISWFAIPVSWLKSGVSAAAGGNFIDSMSNIQEIMDNIRDEIYYINEMHKIQAKRESWWAKVTKALTGNWLDFALQAWYYIKAAWIEAQIKSYWFLYIFLFILIIAICFMQLVSIFMSSVILAFAPLLVPCIAISPLKSFFFSWMKLYISIAMYQPFSLLIMAMAYKSVQIMSQMGAKAVWDDAFAACLPSIIIAICSFYCITKIPQWVNQLMGTQVTGMGEGMAQGVKGAASVAGAAASKYAAKKALKASGKVMQASGKGLDTGGKGAMQFGKAVAQGSFKAAAASLPTIIGPIAFGAIGTAGLGTAVAGAGMRIAGKTMQKSGKMMEGIADNMKVTNKK